MAASGIKNCSAAPLHPHRRTLATAAALVSISAFGALAVSGALGASGQVSTKANTIAPHFDHTPLRTDPCGTVGYTAFGSGILNVAIPDNQIAGIQVGGVLTAADGRFFDDVKVAVGIQHTYAGDVALGIWYDQDNDGFGDVGPVMLMCTPGLPGCSMDGCCGCDGDLITSYTFMDDGIGVLGEVSCQPVLPADCYTPDSDSPPLDLFEGLPDGGTFLLYAWDWEAGDVGVVQYFTVFAKLGCGNPVRDVPGEYATITSAINAACNGDVIRLQPGVYHESVNITHDVGKALLTSAVPGQKAVIDNLHYENYRACPDLRDIEVLGGAYFSDGDYPQYATDCIFHGAVAFTGGGGNVISLNGVVAKNGLSILGDAAEIGNCELGALNVYADFYINVETSDLGVTNLDAAHDATIGLVENTIHGEVLLKDYTDAVLSRNIVARSTLGAIGIRLQPNSGASTTTSCNDVWNFSTAWAGIGDQTGSNGNIIANPRFCDPLVGNYYLDAASPCAPGHHPNGFDCDTIGRNPVGCSLPAAVGDSPLAAVPLVTAQPNPSRGFVTFTLAPGSAPARIRIVDAGGRSVREIEFPASSSQRQASWDQTDAAGNRVASGVYFYRVRSGRQESTKQLVVLN